MCHGFIKFTWTTAATSAAFTVCRKCQHFSAVKDLYTLFLHRYEPKTNELINEELGIAYPVIDGIPNMIPQEARLIRKDASDTPAQ